MFSWVLKQILKQAEELESSYNRAEYIINLTLQILLSATVLTHATEKVLLPFALLIDTNILKEFIKFTELQTLTQIFISQMKLNTMLNLEEPK